MKKIIIFAMIISCLSGCNIKDDSIYDDDGNIVIEEIKIYFVPSTNSEDIEKSIEPLDELMKEILLKKGYKINKINSIVGVDYTMAGEALVDGLADIAFIPAGTYVDYKDYGVELLVSATRKGLSKDSLDPNEWNDGLPTLFIEDKDVSYYRSIGITGPSIRGKNIADKLNTNQELLWEDISDCNFCFIKSKTSTAGYIYPLVWLKENYNKGIDDIKILFADEYEDSIAHLAVEECDLAVGYADFRLNYQDKWINEYQREKSIWEETSVFMVTDKIMNDTISYSTNSVALDSNLVKALQETMVEIGSSEEGRKIFDIYNHTAYMVTKDSDYDSTRQALEAIKE